MKLVILLYKCQVSNLKYKREKFKWDKEQCFCF